MANRKLRYGGRKRALFGAEAAATLAAAAIQAAATNAAAIMGANAQKSAAKEQAKATLDNAARQAAAMKEQNENSNQLYNEQQELIKSQNEENRQLQKDFQMQLQLAMGRENMRDRLEQSKIQVRNGGKTNSKRKLANRGLTTSLWGVNMPFTVTDGGGVMPIGITPEGFNLYEIKGDNHEQYHKSSGGKYKTGVGIKFGNGEVIEGEGDGSRRRFNNGGELLMTTPDGGYFISKHTLNGFNPAESVKEGLNPMIAFNIQEQIKDANGISDDGKHNSSPVGKNRRRLLRLAGGIVNPYLAELPTNGQAMFNNNSLNDGGFTYAMLTDVFNKDGQKAKCGKRVKAHYGTGTYLNSLGYMLGNDIPSKAALSMVYKNLPTLNVTDKMPKWSLLGNTKLSDIKPNIPTVPITSENLPTQYVEFDTNQNGTTTAPSKSGNFWNGIGGQLVGAGIGTLGNIIGGIITNAGNNSAANIIGSAQQRAADIMSNAYNNLKTVDMDIIDKDTYKSTHIMPAVHTARINDSSRIEKVGRDQRRLLEHIGRTPMSANARYSLMNGVMDRGYQQRSQIYEDTANREEQARQRTAETINRAAEINAQLDMQTNKDYTNARLDLAKYNNSIENQKILGAAGAQSDAANAIGETRAALKQNTMNTWAGIVGAAGQSGANIISSNIKYNRDRDNLMLGASTEARVLNTALTGTRNQKSAMITMFQSAINSGKLSQADIDLYKRYIATLNG